MFDIGFSEFLVIGLVALVVIGPERLPKVARTLGVLISRAQRYVSTVKADINREIEASEFADVKKELTSSVESLNQDLHQFDQNLQTYATEVNTAVNSVASEAQAITSTANGLAAGTSAVTADTSASTEAPAADMNAASEAVAASTPSPQDPSPGTKLS